MVRMDRNSGSETVTSESRRRRRFLLRLVVAAASLSSSAVTTIATAPSHAALLAGSSGGDRRQLELCLVAVQRAVYWSESQAAALRDAAADNDEQRRRALYLETRLGAKALLTRRVGAGATARVYSLASLQLPGCLRDLEWHAEQRRQRRESNAVTDLRQAFSEGLASVVEFDGLETLTDPSPRSSLTLSQWNDGKVAYVRRALEELVVPTGNRLLRAFGPDALDRARGFVRQYYASEIYPPPPSPELRTEV